MRHCRAAEVYLMSSLVEKRQKCLCILERGSGKILVRKLSGCPFKWFCCQSSYMCTSISN
jgi:hypothetical protein